MNHDDYVAAAYAVFAAVLTWDYLAPRLRMRRTWRAIARRAQRAAGQREPGDRRR